MFYDRSQLMRMTPSVRTSTPASSRTSSTADPSFFSAGATRVSPRPGARWRAHRVTNRKGCAGASPLGYHGARLAKFRAG